MSKNPEKPAAEPSDNDDDKKTIPLRDARALLQQLSLAQQAPASKEGKAPEEYKFWNTQPVVKFNEPNLLQTTDGPEGGESLPEGPILPDKICKASAKLTGGPLPDGFEWCELDLADKAELQEFYTLLFDHYVEDVDGNFRFNYSPEFLTWALKPPGWKKEWHVGVRTKSAVEGKKGKLVATITAIPVNLRVRDGKFSASEVNFLAVHRKLRNKRLAPVLIREITRRCYINGIYQALYTAGTLLPTPVSTCRYYHRSLDWPHLYKNGFSHLPIGSTELRQKLKYKLETQTATKGLREMTPADAPAVQDLLTRYGERFAMRQEFTHEEILHWFCSDVSKGVSHAYVVEDAKTHKITDFISYYGLESTVLRSGGRDTINAAYLYYYATETAFSSSSSDNTALQSRLQSLMHDALILAQKQSFHVFNALSLLDNPLFLKEEKFEPGDGKLHFYLFNWRTASINSGLDERQMLDKEKMGGVGVVML